MSANGGTGAADLARIKGDTRPIATSAELGAMLRAMLTVLEAEREALTTLDLDGILGASGSKGALCGRLEATRPSAMDEECRGMLEAARHLNEVNRQLRNLVAANVSARLEALTGVPATYDARGGAPAAAYAYAGARG